MSKIKKWKKVLEMEHFLKTFKESNFERIERLEEKLETLSNQVVGFVQLSSENRRRITELEADGDRKLTDKVILNFFNKNL